ncbi:MAG: alpha/beta fold hydrolase [Gemmatimonadetes bacterium]|nr:alpha/beta fold hydrolase [Gemmatimonadota bacterium]NNM06569.1 alpha/beta fold hydrolase [Gemmatimonadota bacterium]
MTSIDFQPDSRLFPFESRWYGDPKGKIHYIDEGEGEPILFLHGNPTWSFLYRGIIIRLKKRFRCIALDLPGFGLSSHPLDYRYTPEEHARAVRRFIRDRNLQNLTIMGHDWGGPIGMRVAVEELDRIRALVMGNTWYWPTTALHLKAFSWILSTGYVQGLIHKKNLFVERIIPLGVKHPLAAEVLQHYRGPFPTVDSRAGIAEFARQIGLSANWLAQVEINVRRHLRDTPLLLTWGMEDLAFTPAFMDTFLRDFENAGVVRLNAKHYIQEDAPGEVSQAIQEFLPG